MWDLQVAFLCRGHVVFVPGYVMSTHPNPQGPSKKRAKNIRTPVTFVPFKSPWGAPARGELAAVKETFDLNLTMKQGLRLDEHNGIKHQQSYSCGSDTGGE